MGDHFHTPIVQLGQRFYIEPMGFCGDFEGKPTVILPTFSHKPAMVSRAFARSSMKRVPEGAIGDWEFFVGQCTSQRRATKNIPLRPQRQDPSKGVGHSSRE